MRVKILPIFWLVILISSQLTSQSVADFSAEDVDGCPPFALELIDESSNPNDILSWEWTSNGDFLSSQQNPASLINTSGLYTICLTVTTSSGINQECKTDFIEVFEPPSAQVLADQQSGCIPLDVMFTDNSISGSGAISEVIWDFGGSCGVISGTPGGTTNCIYSGAGEFQISMIVVDENGCQDNLIEPDFIQTFPLPTLTAQIPTYDNCEPPFVVDFNNAGPTNSDIQYSWTFGDGQTFDGNNPAPITYNGSGPYTVSVTAVNSITGCINSLTLDGLIEESNPLSFNFNRTSNCEIPEVSFTDESIGSADQILWDFGDGTTSSMTSPLHTYSDFGCYTITLTRTVGNCTKSIQEQICLYELSENAISANIADDFACDFPFSTDFSVNFTQGFTYTWDFGDGEMGTGISPSHTYTDFGNYPVQLTVVDDLGCTYVELVGTVVVAPISVTLNNSGVQGCAPLSVNFDPEVISSSAIQTYNWEIVDESNLVIFQSSQANPSYTFTDIGCYSVNLLVDNIEGCQSTLNFNDFYCVGAQPFADFTFTPSTGCVDQEFSFTDQSTGEIDSWQWDFQSNGTIYDINPNAVFTYGSVACFDATLTVSNFGCSSTLTSGPICIVPPVSSFSIELDCDNPTTVDFTSTSTGADSLIWDFGVDGDQNDTSTLVQTQFQFPSLGLYETSLISYNFTTGCTDTATFEIDLSVPQASFEIEGNQFCKNEVIPITNTSIGATSYNWTASNGGSLSSSTSEAPSITFSESGTYSIELSIEDENLCAANDTILNIEVSGPEIAFDYSLSGNCIPFEVQLTNSSTNLLANNELWEWNISTLDLNFSDENPSFQMDTAGIFDIEFLIEDDRGCRDSILQSISLNEGAPVAFFTGDFFGCEGVANSFEDLSVGNNLGYNWDFGDGNFSNDQHPMHEFNLGDYQVNLTVMDNDCSHTHTELVQIQNIEAAFSVDSSYSSCVPSPVNFINESQNGVSYFWNYGDETGVMEIEEGSHIYNYQGVFDVSLFVVGENEKCVDSLLIEDLVQLQGPQADFEYAINDFCIPSELELSVNGERPYNYLIFFGDGSSLEIEASNLVNTNFTYEIPTNLGFVPTVFVQESEGCELVLIGTDTIFLSELSIEVEADETILCFDDRTVVFESEIFSSDTSYQLNWEFESGSPSNSNINDVAVTFMDPGFYDVKLVVENNHCKDSIMLPEHISVFDIAELNIEDQSACYGDTITIIAETNTDFVNWNIDSEIIYQDSLSISFISTDDFQFSAFGSIGPCPETIDSASFVALLNPELDMENFFIYFPGTEITLGPEAVDSLNYFWTSAELLNCSLCPNPMVLDTIGDFQLTVTNPASGCFSEDIVQVRQYSQCPDFSIILPNVFSPNGDGKNDEFRAYSQLLEDIEFLRVYDRWGNFLWETDSIDEGWDGTFKGKIVQPGVYVYMIQAVCSIDGKPFTKEGDITVLR